MSTFLRYFLGFFCKIWRTTGIGDKQEAFLSPVCERDSIRETLFQNNASEKIIDKTEMFMYIEISVIITEFSMLLKEHIHDTPTPY